MKTVKVKGKIAYWFDCLLAPLSAVLVVLGLMLIVGLFFILSGQYQISASSSVDLAATAQVGDFIGGFVGAMWSLAGVLLFYSALLLQRKEFELQRHELQDQRQELATSRVVNVLYQQLDKLSQKASALKLGEHNENVRSMGGSVISDLPLFYSIDFAPMTEVDTSQHEKHSVYRSFVLSADAKEYLRFLDKTTTVCVGLIEQNKQRGFAGQPSYLLDVDVRVQLFVLFDSNLDSFLHLTYLTTLKRIHENHVKIVRHSNPDANSPVLLFGRQQIVLLDKLIGSLKLVLEHTRQTKPDEQQSHECEFSDSAPD